MSATWVTFLFEAANFLLLAGVLGWLFFRPVRDLLEKRRREIDAEQQAAAKAHAEADRALQEARARQVELEKARRNLEDEVRKEAEDQRSAILESARAQADREREKLKEELQSLRRAQGQSAIRDAAFAAGEIVTRLLERLGGSDLDAQLLAEACREVEKLRDAGSLAPVVAEAAHPLGDAGIKALADAAGVTAEDVQARVEPDLVAGVRVMTSRGLVDVTATGLAAQAEKALEGRMAKEEGGHG